MRMSTFWYGMDSYAWFGAENRTSASVNCDLCLLTFVWLVIYASVVFLLLTGVGRKFSTLITTTLSVISGATITLGIVDREWVHGRLQTEASYSRFMPSAVPGILSVSLGLHKMNISYVSLDPGLDFFYNEQFKLDDEWHSDNILQEEYVKALERGSPNPVLEILEFFTFGGFAFVYRKAGFVTLTGLWISLTMWAFCQALLLVVPKAASRGFFFTGSMTLLSAIFYFNSIPSASLQMYVEGVRLELSIGRTFYLVVIGALINIALGVVFGVGARCKTSFEVYYGTKFDFYGKGKKNFENFEMKDIDENGRWAEGWNDDYKNYSENRVCDTNTYPRPVRNRVESVCSDKDDYQLVYVNEGFMDDSEITSVQDCFVNETLSGENLLNLHREVTNVNIETPVRDFIRKSKFFRKSKRIKISQVLLECEDDDTEKGIDDRHTDVLNNIRRVQPVIKDSMKDKPEPVVDDVIWYDTVDSKDLLHMNPEIPSTLHDTVDKLI